MALKPCWCYSNLRDASMALPFFSPFPGALNSAVECHLHTVEVAGSNPAAPTIKINNLQQKIRPCQGTTLAVPQLPRKGRGLQPLRPVFRRCGLCGGSRGVQPPQTLQRRLGLQARKPGRCPAHRPQRTAVRLNSLCPFHRGRIEGHDEWDTAFSLCQRSKRRNRCVGHLPLLACKQRLAAVYSRRNASRSAFNWSL